MSDSVLRRFKRLAMTGDYLAARRLRVELQRLGRARPRLPIWCDRIYWTGDGIGNSSSGDGVGDGRGNGFGNWRGDCFGNGSNGDGDGNGIGYVSLFDGIVIRVWE